MGDGGAFAAWWAKRMAESPHPGMILLTDAESLAGMAWDAATERAAGEAAAEVWDCRDAEAKAVAKGASEYTPEFRAAVLAERIGERIRGGGA